MDKIEFLVLRSLINNEQYLRKVLPFIKKEYFEDESQKIIFEEISSFVLEYDKVPTKEILSIETEKRSDINQEQFNNIINIISNLDEVSVELKWLVDTTEKWCKDRAIYLALIESIHIADGKNEKKTRDSIPSILSDALAVSFDNHVGHDYLLDYEQRFEAYQKVEDKIPFDITYLNKITKGGISKKTLSIFMASTGVGKSLTLCHIAASTLLQNKNVLYITLEMSEDKIAERIDANLMNVDIKEFPTMSKSSFESKLDSIARKTQGSLIIKEYPTASAHTGHFKSLINELQLKKSFVPDLLIIDYMNICTSSRYKSNLSVNSYNYVKAIAEELRGLAVEYNVPLITATQVNRSGMNNSDIDLTDTSESIGGPMTADLLLALIATEELEDLNQIMIKQLKNRYADPTVYKRFVVGIDRAKMRLYDVEQSAQEEILDLGKKSGYDDEEQEAKLKEKFGGFKF